MYASGHVHQPLSIDTNIVYDLDMSKFPGLDTECMYEPTLVIATEESRASWMLALEKSDDEHAETSQLLSDDLFLLIESCTSAVKDQMASSEEELVAAQDLFDEVVDSTSTPTDDAYEELVPYGFHADYHDCLHGHTEAPDVSESPPCDVTGRGCQKRKRTDDTEIGQAEKKVKTPDSSWTCWKSVPDSCKISINSTQQPYEFSREC